MKAIRELGGEAFLRSIQEARETETGGSRSSLIAVKLTYEQVVFLEERIKGLKEYAEIVNGSDRPKFTLPDLLHLLVQKYLDEARW